MDIKKEKNPAAVAMGKMMVAKHGVKHMSEIGRKGMASRWYGHIKRGNAGKKKTVVKTDSSTPDNVL
jgi:hypothetical protein